MSFHDMLIWLTFQFKIVYVIDLYTAKSWVFLDLELPLDDSKQDFGELDLDVLDF